MKQIIKTTETQRPYAFAFRHYLTAFLEVKPIMDKEIKRGDMFYCDLSPVVGSEQGGIRPVLILQNNIGNAFSPTTIIAAAITSKTDKPPLPTHVALSDISGLEKDSLLLLEQIRTVDRSRLRGYIGLLDDLMMESVNKALCISLGLQYIYD